MRGMPNDAEKSPDAELREELSSMEARVRKMRDNRNSMREQGKAMAKKRNAVQDQYKEHREKLDLMKAELDAIHADVSAAQRGVRSKATAPSTRLVVSSPFGVPCRGRGAGRVERREPRLKCVAQFARLDRSFSGRSGAQ